jgi:glutathione S-transferase
MADLIIYGFPQSTYVRSARMACIEKGVPYVFEPERPHSETVLKRHPWGHVPALDHGDFTLYEASAILHYIDDAFDGPRLAPSDPRARARMEQWISVINAYFYGPIIHRMLLQYIVPKGPDGKPDRAVIDKAADEARKAVAVLDDALAEGPFLLGANLSLADLLLCPIMAYLAQMPEGQAMLRATRNIPRAAAAMQTRKSYIETVPPPPPKPN